MDEVVETGLAIPFLSGELWSYSIIHVVTLRRGSPTRTGEEFLTQRQIIMPTHCG